MAISFALPAILPILLILFSVPSIVNSLSFSKLELPAGATGPESTTFDSFGGGPYTGVADGRIVKYQSPNIGFQDYAFDTPNRSKAVCDGNTNPALGNLCGRPLGLGFYRITGELYIADAYKGLLVAGPNGRLARSLATGAEGVPFKFPDGLVVQQTTGLVYFTDASSKYSLGEILLAVAANDSTGRLLKYDPTTNNVTVLLRNLSGPAGVAVSLDGTFLLVTEFIGKRIIKYWLTGPRANTSEVLLSLPGRPENIKRAPIGNFWVAQNIQTPPSQANIPVALKIDRFGNILANISLSEQYNNTLISEVYEYQFGIALIGSMYTNFIGRYTII